MSGIPRGHTVVVTDDPEWDGESPYKWERWTLRLECHNVQACGGWTECQKDHTGLDPNDEDSAAFDQTEFKIHGVLHQWQYGGGWSVPYTGCIVACLSDLDDLWDQIHMPGRYLVDDDMDDIWCSLTVAGMIS